MDLALTEAGKRRVAGTRDQSTGARMLGHIESNGRLSIEEIASVMKMPVHRAKSIANRMYKAGLVRVDD